mmetsp:Transcript_37051/g.121162  ORF Transcript_37051/g.121162 Transcript_37051/m.121162 type:complete len:455 (-) Transcript_37051:23-1387(-)
MHTKRRVPPSTAVDSSLRGRLVALPQASVVLARQVVPLEYLEPAQRGALAAAQLHHLVPQRLGQAKALLQCNRPRARDGPPHALAGGQACVAAEEPAERERRGATGGDGLDGRTLSACEDARPGRHLDCTLERPVAVHQQPTRLLLRRSSQVRAQIVSERGEQRADQRLRRSRLPQQQLRQLPVPARRQGAVQSDSVRTRGRGAKHEHDLLPLLPGLLVRLQERAARRGGINGRLAALGLGQERLKRLRDEPLAQPVAVRRVGQETRLLAAITGAAAFGRRVAAVALLRDRQLRLEARAECAAQHAPSAAAAGAQALRQLRLEWHPEQHAARLHWRLVRPAPLGVLAPQLLALLFQQRLVAGRDDETRCRGRRCRGGRRRVVRCGALSVRRRLGCQLEASGDELLAELAPLLRAWTRGGRVGGAQCWSAAASSACREQPEGGAGRHGEEEECGA